MADQEHDIKKDSTAPDVKPTGHVVDEEDTRTRYFTSAPMKSAIHLMDALYDDDTFYQQATFAWVGPEDAKKLFLYGVCKEVMKAAAGLIEDKGYVQEEPEDKNPDRLSRMVFGSISDKQTYRIRKLIELLSLVILFDRNTKRDEEYRIFLNAESLDLHLTRLQDFKDLYSDKTIENTQSAANDFVERIENDLKTLGVPSLWYLDADQLKKRRPSVFARKRRIHLDALAVATPDERAALGVSYGRGYSQTSEAVHPMLGSHDYGRDENKPKHIRANFSYIGLLGMHIMHLAHKIAGLDDPHGIDKVMGKGFEKSEASKHINTLKREFQVGDIVLTAWTDIAEIVDSTTGRYGDKAYRIKYLSRAPIPSIPEDWIESQRILVRLMSKSEMRKILTQEMTSESSPKELREILPEVLKQTDEELMKSAAQMFLDLHKAGVLIPMLLKQGTLKRTDQE